MGADGRRANGIAWPRDAMWPPSAPLSNLALWPKPLPRRWRVMRPARWWSLATGHSGSRRNKGDTSPQATCILDWAHLWREVRHAILVAARAKGLSAQARDYQLWWHRTYLWQGHVEQALEGLRRLATDLPAEALKPVQEAIRYLENQRPWIGSYERWKAQGYPVGSGLIERAVALVINRRMKKRGMRWCRPNATAIVALRTDLLNDDWDTPQQLRSYP